MNIFRHSVLAAAAAALFLYEVYGLSRWSIDIRRDWLGTAAFLLSTIALIVSYQIAKRQPRPANQVWTAVAFVLVLVTGLGLSL